jgi:microcystin-dependent protein
MGATPFVGEIMMFAGNFAPAGWALCNGQLMAISQNTALFSLLGTFYGGDGVTTFALPNLQSRVAIHQGQGPGLSPYVLGQQAGTETVTVTQNEMPSHNHAAVVVTIGASDSPVNKLPASDPGGNVAQFKTGAANAQMAANAVNLTGGNQPHSNIQPVLTLNFCIALFGVFPSRN